MLSHSPQTFAYVGGAQGNVTSGGKIANLLSGLRTLHTTHVGLRDSLSNFWGSRLGFCADSAARW